MKVLASLVFIIAACPLFPSPIITTSVWCQSYGAPIITAVSTCEQGGPLNTQDISPSYAFASAEASVTLQTQATDWLTVSMKNTVNPVDGEVWLREHGQFPPFQVNAPASASAAINVHIDSFTLGPVRPGILQIQWSPILAVSELNPVSILSLKSVRSGTTTRANVTMGTAAKTATTNDLLIKVINHDTLFIILLRYDFFRSFARP